jgi:hypothetical protein
MVTGGGTAWARMHGHVVCVSYSMCRDW